MNNYTQQSDPERASRQTRKEGSRKEGRRKKVGRKEVGWKGLERN